MSRNHTSEELRPKKRLGQHFLTNESIAQSIVDALDENELPVLEIGPGTGALTNFLVEIYSDKLWLSELDIRSVDLLKRKYPNCTGRIIKGDFLSLNIEALFPNGVNIIGNFPYNISNQILFKIFDNKTVVHQVVGMFQKEVAQRVCAVAGNRQNGILSVLLEAYYHRVYLFEIDKAEFNPPPKVQSAAVKLDRNSTFQLPYKDAELKKLVKAAFSQRRKKLRNALRPHYPESDLSARIFDKRAEELSLQDYLNLLDEY